ncbi:MAG: porin [Thiomonas delicata]
MKKTLLSLAMFGAFTGAAMAQSNVQLYGIVDLGFEHLTYDNTSVNRIGSGIQSGSRIGLKGTEDLGGGLSAFFQAETGYCANGNGPSIYGGASQGAQYQAGGSYCTSGTTFMGRTSVVGLQGAFGTFSMGRMYTSYFNAAGSVDPFGVGLTGSLTNIDQGLATYPYLRTSQTAAYVTPNLSGFQGSVMYGFGAQPGSTSNGQLYDLNAQYSNGPILVGVDYLHHNLTTSPTAYNANKMTALYGSYNFGVATVSGYYAQQKGMITSTTAQQDQRVWMLGATVPVGPGSILASYSQNKDNNLANSTSKMYAIGYTYALSKRTNLYTSYARMSNDTNADLYIGDATVGGAGNIATNGGASASGFALGIRHKF